MRLWSLLLLYIASGVLVACVGVGVGVVSLGVCLSSCVIFERGRCGVFFLNLWVFDVWLFETGLA